MLQNLLKNISTNKLKLAKIENYQNIYNILLLKLSEIIIISIFFDIIVEVVVIILIVSLYS